MGPSALFEGSREPDPRQYACGEEPAGLQQTMVSRLEKRSGGGVSDSPLRVDFWQRYLRVGFIVVGGEALVAVIYFALAPGLAHRPAFVDRLLSTATTAF
jgi:hypothetical protein